MKLRKGITLIELLVAIPLLSIILLIAYNMLFMASRSFKYTNDTFNTGEDIRLFTTTIQKEANQAKKANDDTPLYKPKANGKELYIYTDLHEEGKPTLIRYKLENNQILRGTESTTNDKNKYPYKFNTNGFRNEKVVLSNVTSSSIFGEVERVREEKKFKDENDHRRRIKMEIEISTGEGNAPIKIHTILTNKSRNEFDD